MAGHKISSRDRILAAAAEVTRETGAASLSLDAVAHRAGISKGGLLYNFPTKAKLMQALVEHYLKDCEATLYGERTNEKTPAPNLLAAYIEMAVQECGQNQPSAAGVLAAMAEDPDFLNPIRDFKRRLLDRLKAESPDTARLIVAFLVLEGLRSLKLFDMDILDDDERDQVFAYLRAEAAPN